MQGRLLPKYRGRYQAHPVGYWMDEFPLASQYGLDAIEFILDHDDYDKNPLIYSTGINEIENIQVNEKIKKEKIEQWLQLNLYALIISCLHHYIQKY